MQQDLAGFGATLQQVARYASDKAKPEPFEVMPVNWLAVMVFSDCGGQWLRDQSSVRVGLSRPAIETSMRLWPVPASQRSDIFHRIRVMEAVAVDEYRKASTR